MRALQRFYTLGVLWLLSAVAKNAAGLIYDYGRADGIDELREDMRCELVKVQVACATDRMRAYNQGYRDAMRFYGDVPDEAPKERVM